MEQHATAVLQTKKSTIILAFQSLCCRPYIIMAIQQFSTYWKPHKLLHKALCKYSDDKV